MNNVQRYSSFIKRITTAPTPIRKKLLHSSNGDIIRAILEIFINIRNRNVELPKQQLAHLRRRSRLIHKLLSIKDVKKQREFLIEHCQILDPLRHVFK